MKRKINLVGQNTLTVSLPKKWVEKNNIKKGDEIDVTEDGAILKFSINPTDTKDKSITLNISGLDRTSIMLVLRGAYRAGYDEIKLEFDKPYTMHHRKKEEISVLQVIHAEASRLIGVSIIKESDSECIIKDFSANLDQEFDPSVRRVFLLLLSMADDLSKGIMENDKYLIKSLEERHDTATKFISYCLRMINKGVVNYDFVRITTLYHVLASLDTVVDIYKYAARDFIPSFKTQISKDAQKLLSKINTGLRIYYELFYEFNNAKCEKFMLVKDEFKNELFKNKKKFTGDEMILLTYMEHVFQILWDLILAKASIK